MKAFGTMLVDGAWVLLVLCAKVLVGTGKLFAWALLPLIAARVSRIKSKPKAMPTKVELAAVQVNVPELPEALTHDTGPQTILHDTFEWADRIVSMRLEPFVGTINLRVFNASKVVKRDLIISEPRLRAMMKGRRHSFPDVPYDYLVGLDEVKDDTIALAEKLINDLGSQSVKATKPRKDDFVRAKAPAPAAPVSASVVKEPVRQQQPRSAPAPAPQQAEVRSQPAQPPSTLVAPRVTAGFTYVGQLVKAGTQQIHPAGRAPYEVFEATLLLDNGAEMALRGAELEREIESHGCKVGARVSITPLGKVPVALANGSEGQKNLYRVQNMAAPKRG
jgi:hypothetical protein